MISHRSPLGRSIEAASYRRAVEEETAPREVRCTAPGCEASITLELLVHVDDDRAFRWAREVLGDWDWTVGAVEGARCPEHA